jgi:hypothetical protein
MCEVGGLEHVLARSDIDWEQYTSDELKALSEVKVSAAIGKIQFFSNI